MHIILEELMAFVDFLIITPKTISLNVMDLLLQLHRNSGTLGLILVNNVKQKYVHYIYKKQLLKLVMFLGK